MPAATTEVSKAAMARPSHRFDRNRRFEKRPLWILFYSLLALVSMVARMRMRMRKGWDLLVDPDVGEAAFWLFGGIEFSSEYRSLIGTKTNSRSKFLAMMECTQVRLSRRVCFCEWVKEGSIFLENASIFFDHQLWNKENGDVVVLVRNDCEFFSSVAECVPNFMSFRLQQQLFAFFATVWYMPRSFLRWLVPILTILRTHASSTNDT